MENYEQKIRDIIVEQLGVAEKYAGSPSTTLAPIRWIRSSCHGD
jgi:hypothetical protein